MIGGNNLQQLITLSILCYKYPITLQNTLESYKKNNLFDITTPHIYFQERYRKKYAKCIYNKGTSKIQT